MGREIEQIAGERGHRIVAKFTSANPPTPEALKQADVAIEFTQPSAVTGYLEMCLKNGIPVVTGTTGWNEELPAITALCEKHRGALFHASNFSLGVNLFFALNQKLAAMMNGFGEYAVRLEETHHTQKKDAPSGTAISLLDQITARLDGIETWKLGNQGGEGIIPVQAHRVKDVPGTHQVVYTSAIDEIEITHRAFNRRGFATGAVLAAEFVIGKTGVFTMNDLLKLNDTP